MGILFHWVIIECDINFVPADSKKLLIMVLLKDSTNFMRDLHIINFSHFVCFMVIIVRYLRRIY